MYIVLEITEEELEEQSTHPAIWDWGELIGTVYLGSVRYIGSSNTNPLEKRFTRADEPQGPVDKSIHHPSE